MKVSSTIQQYHAPLERSGKANPPHVPANDNQQRQKKPPTIPSEVNDSADKKHTTQINYQYSELALESIQSFKQSNQVIYHSDLSNSRASAVNEGERANVINDSPADEKYKAISAYQETANLEQRYYLIDTFGFDGFA